MKAALIAVALVLSGCATALQAAESQRAVSVSPSVIPTTTQNRMAETAGMRERYTRVQPVRI